MNFPGLDPAWTTIHHSLHALGASRTWTLAEIRASLADGEKVLVVATTALGDSLLITPLLETLSRTLSPERLSILVRKPYAELYRDDPRVGRVFTVRGKFRWNGLASHLRSDPHRVAFLANMTEPDLVPYLRWCGVRGFLRYRSRWTRFPRWMANQDMLRRPTAPDYATSHAIENNLAMAEALGLLPATHELSLPHLRDSPGNKSHLILIHPGASREVKRWPLENWAALADRVVAKTARGIVLTGNGNERLLAESVKSAMKFGARAQVAAGNLSLVELARMQASAMAFVSGDTGPYHLAIAVGCPTVTLFAPTDRGSSTEACGPHQASPRFHRALETARFYDSISTLSVDRVWAELQPLLER